MIRCHCPSCGKSLKARRELAGRKVGCKDCGHSFRLPVAASVPVPEPDFDFPESPPDDKPKPIPATRGYGRRQATPPGRRMWPWVSVGVVALVALGVGVWAATRGAKPKPVDTSQVDPGTPTAHVVKADRYDGEWTGPERSDHRVDGIIIDKNEFPCTGAVRMGDANMTASVPVRWARKNDELIGTDDRDAPAVGPALAKVRLVKGLLSGEAKAPKGTLFIPSGTQTFAGFKRTGPPPARKLPPPAPPPPPSPPVPAELLVGKWSGKYPVKKISGEVETLDETWEFKKDGTFHRVILLGGATATYEGPYRVVDENSLELGTSGGGAKLVWKMTLKPDVLVIAHPTKPEPGAGGEGTSTLRRTKDSPKTVVPKTKVNDKPPDTVEEKPDFALSDQVYKRLEKSKRTIHPFYAKAATGGKLEVKNGKDVGWNDVVAGWHPVIGWAWSSVFAGLSDGTVFVNIGPHPVATSAAVVGKGECVVLRKGQLVKADLAELEAEEGR
jgi:hypothetical protein